MGTDRGRVRCANKLKWMCEAQVNLRSTSERAKHKNCLFFGHPPACKPQQLEQAGVYYIFFWGILREVQMRGDSFTMKPTNWSHCNQNGQMLSKGVTFLFCLCFDIETLWPIGFETNYQEMKIFVDNLCAFYQKFCQILSNGHKALKQETGWGWCMSYDL